ncbi:flavodoxin family protein [Limosilactobacillus sp. STM2_1]|uniref:Flavodoxin family protein n=1 Tax=Limosilactobacillus rudii TaxID=2759755 RepID=A0A7W3YMI5_9LACO|nr:flavodoxin family protein [Limosilactobacillus rudii]MBB1078485.1 flavodoxin family protein [Limosilactobacillus rudii]MBB1096615.1 flavodoxin family protein [Limosilactobacillus rudii]MCD7134189.1 flavodoxin family protein [Limosilactobacillus rudii]
MAKILFINASENINGNTVKLAVKLLKGLEYQQINLVDYKIYQIGQLYPDDQFNEIYQAMVDADTIILGTPVYWHDMSAYLKTLIERISQKTGRNELARQKIALVVQGASPVDGVKMVDKTISGFCRVGNMDYLGKASASLGLTKLREKIQEGIINA